jgi:hypothetical protein
MKTYRLAIFIIIFLYSCKSELKTDKIDLTNDSIPKKEEYLSASKIIYNNSKCLDWNIETLPIIDLESDSIFFKKNIKCTIFFSSNYLRKLAKCNNLDYKFSFDLYKSNGEESLTFETQKDTLSIDVPLNELKIINSTKLSDEYIIKGKLRASYFKHNKVLGYDTMMIIKKKFIVLKDGYKK